MGDSNAAEDHWGLRLEGWAKRTWPTLCDYAGTVLLAFAGLTALIWAKDYGWAVATAWATFGAGAVLTGLGRWGGHRARAGAEQSLQIMNDLKTAADSRAEAIEAVLKAMIAEVCRELGTWNEHTRVSLYAFAEDSFVILARTSHNPDLRMQGRRSYPMKEGTIGRTWQDGKSLVPRLPSDRADWNLKMGEYGIPLDVAASIKMQCLSILGIRVDKMGTHPAEPVAVLVIESLRPQGVTSAHMDKVPTLAAWKTLEMAATNASAALPEVERSLIAS